MKGILTLWKFWSIVGSYWNRSSNNPFRRQRNQNRAEKKTWAPLEIDLVLSQRNMYWMIVTRSTWRRYLQVPRYDPFPLPIWNSHLRTWPMVMTAFVPVCCYSPLKKWCNPYRIFTEPWNKRGGIILIPIFHLTRLLQTSWKRQRMSTLLFSKFWWWKKSWVQIIRIWTPYIGWWHFWSFPMRSNILPTTCYQWYLIEIRSWHPMTRLHS